MESQGRPHDWATTVTNNVHGNKQPGDTGALPTLRSGARTVQGAQAGRQARVFLHRRCSLHNSAAASAAGLMRPSSADQGGQQIRSVFNPLRYEFFHLLSAPWPCLRSSSAHMCTRVSVVCICVFVAHLCVVHTCVVCVLHMCVRVWARRRPECTYRK